MSELLENVERLLLRSHWVNAEGHPPRFVYEALDGMELAEVVDAIRAHDGRPPLDKESPA